MCSITINNTVEVQLQNAGKHDAEMITNRLITFAAEANIQIAGPLDGSGMKRMPPDLRGVNKIKVGRHRVYVRGHHTQCHYHAFYVKVNKRTGVDDEDNPTFQSKLISALRESGTLGLGSGGV